MSRVKLILREWNRELIPSELTVLLGLLDRTTFWGKDSAIVKIEELANGNEAVNGGYRCGMKGLEERQVRRIIDSLAEREFIFKRKRKYGVEVQINFDRKVERMSLLKTPKTKKGIEKASRPDTGDTLVRTPMTELGPDTDDRTYNRKVTNREKVTKEKVTKSDELAPVTASQVVEKIKERDREKRKSGWEIAKSKRCPSLKDLEAAWKHGWMQSFGNSSLTYRSWTNIEKKHVKDLRKKIHPPEGMKLAEFFEWAARLWITVVETELAWMGKKKPFKAAPRKPNVRFLLWRYGDFIDAYNGIGEFHGSIEAYKRKRKYDNLRERGYSEEEIEEVESAKGGSLKGELNSGSKKRGKSTFKLPPKKNPISHREKEEELRKRLGPLTMTREEAEAWDKGTPIVDEVPELITWEEFAGEE